MEKEKQRKIIKILGWLAFALVLVLIVVLCIVSASYKKEASELKDKNEQIEEVLQISSQKV